LTCDVKYERLAAFTAGDLGPAAEAEIRRHASVCGRCRARLEALGQTDAELAALPPLEPPPATVQAARQLLSEVTREAAPRQIMTLDQVGEFLRLDPVQLDEIVEELPAFELAGQIRIRRERLIEWIEQRERAYARHTASSWVARAASATAPRGGLQ
jgi:hypothetical protein